MAEPVSWLALQVIKSMIEQITTANGYRTDLGAGLVLTDRSQVPAEDAAFTLIVGGDISELEEKSSRRITNSEMDVTIEFALPLLPDINPELLAHRGRADIVRAFKGATLPPGDGLGSIRITGTAIGSPDSGAAIVIAQVTARAGLTESNVPA